MKFILVKGSIMLHWVDKLPIDTINIYLTQSVTIFIVVQFNGFIGIDFSELPLILWVGPGLER